LVIYLTVKTLIISIPYFFGALSFRKSQDEISFKGEGL
jgi:hypothetical protein